MPEETLTEILHVGNAANGSVLDINGDLGEIGFLHEPAEYSGQIGAQYDEEGAVGQSFAHMAFKNTANERIPITLYYSRILIAEKYGNSLGWNVDDINHEMEVHKNFFRALLTPPELATGLVNTQPATAILIVPGIMSLNVRLVGFNWTVHDRDPIGKPMRQTFQLQFVEAPTRRWDSMEILERGYQRS